MFPLFDSSGRVIAFSGRLFGEENTEAPKYLNSPETVLFKKSATLYGFDKAKYAIKKYDYAILVEGQFDLVLLHQAGFINTVATSGTAVSEDSVTDSRSALHTLSRLTSNIILAFDGDVAGEKATIRTAGILLALGMNIKIMSLPEKKDPADIVLEGGAPLCKQLIIEAKNLFVWVTENIKVHGYSPHLLRKALEKDIFPLLQRVHSEVEKRGYIADIAQILEVSSDALARDYESFSLTHTYMQTEEAQSAGFEESYAPDEVLQAFMLHYPESRQEIEKNLREEEVLLEEKDELRPALLFFVESQYGKLDTAQKDQTLSELIKKVSVSHHRNQLVILKKALYTMDPGTQEYQNTLAHIDQLQKKIHTRFHTQT
jgi:DNA primase